MYLFDYYAVIRANGTEELYPNRYSKEGDFYNLREFATYTVTLDLNFPQKCEEALSTLALAVEAHSPIAKYFNKPDNVGEGVYLWCIETKDHPTYRLKAKGDKHGGKPKRKKTQKESPEKVKALEELADKVTPSWRLQQGIQETNATSQKDIGALLKWVNQDIIKEESEVIEQGGSTHKELQRYISKITKDYFLDQIKG
jgi:hypothetical protein